MIETINKEYNIRDFSQHNISAFIDNSGSTCSKVSNMNILETEIALAKKIVKSSNNMVYWSTFVSFGKNAYPNGGTNPSCIFANDTSKRLFDSSDIVLFFTDGEIYQNEVTSFSNELKSRLNKALYVCIIVNRSYDNLSSLNVSVIAPMILATNVLCLYHNARINKSVVIASKGDITKYYPNPTELNFNNLQEVKIQDLLNLKLSSQILPKDSIIVNETVDSYKIIDINKLYTQENVALELDESEWTNLIKHSIVSNKLPKLREIIIRSQNIELNKLKDNLKDKLELVNLRKRDQIIDAMTLAYLSNNIEEQNKLKRELDDIKDLARQEEIMQMEFMKKNIDIVKKKWNAIRNMIHTAETENNMYSLSNFSFASNRAARASSVNNDKLEEYEFGICYSTCPEIDCTIHLDKGPCVLWLQKFDDIEYTTNDFCLNYPLSMFPKLSKTLISNPVCGNCANSFIKFTNKSVYRENIDGYIPINWNFNQNIKFSEGVLSKIFCADKMLPHVKMLLLSVIDDLENIEWFEPYKQYFRDQLINNIYTTTTFSEEGSKASLKDALKYIINDESNILRQSFHAAARILKLSAEQGYNSTDIITMAQRRFAYFLVEQYCSFVKYDNNFNVNDKIYHILYDNLCGIPIENRNRIVTLKNDLFLEFIDNHRNNYILALEKVFNATNQNIDQFISDKFIANILWNLSKQTLHKRPLCVYTDLMIHEKTFRSLNEVIDIYNLMNEHKFGRYYKETGRELPGYAFYNGEYSCPSKLYYINTPLWTSDMDNKTFDIQELCDIFKSKLQNEMTKYLGSYYPTKKSSHTLTHITVSKIIEQKYSGEKEMNDDIIIDCLKVLAKTQGNYGNIYKENMLQLIMVIGNDFFRVKNTMNYSSGNAETDKSNLHKLKSELMSYGMQCSDNKVLFKTELIKPPIVLLTPELDNYEELVSRLNTKFLLKN